MLMCKMAVINKYLLEPYIIKDCIGRDQYNQLLKATLPLLLEDVLLDIHARMWFQHDGAPPHFTSQVNHLPGTNYPERRTGQRGPASWPPHSQV
jgi:hypothetical protein